MDVQTTEKIAKMHARVARMRANKLLSLIRWLLCVCRRQAFVVTKITASCQADKDGKYPVKIRINWDRSFMSREDKEALKAFNSELEAALIRLIYTEFGIFARARIDASFKHGGFGFRLRVHPRTIEGLGMVPVDVLVTGDMDNLEESRLDFVDSRTTFEDIKKTVDARFRLDNDTFRKLFETPWEC